MADIDKALPNEVKKSIEIEGQEKAQEENIELQETLPKELRDEAGDNPLRVVE